jgi:hypothetical protein
MADRELFLWGFLGSFAIEVVAAYQAINSNHGRLPIRYKRLPFFVVRFFLALVAGGLAVAYEIQSALLAIHVGAATPLILQRFARTVPGAAALGLHEDERGSAPARGRR